MQHSAFQRDGESTDALEYSKKHPRMRNDMRAHKQLSTGHITGLMLCFHQTTHFSGKNALHQTGSYTCCLLKFHSPRVCQVKAGKWQPQGRPLPTSKSRMDGQQHHSKQEPRGAKCFGRQVNGTQRNSGET